MSDGAGNPAWSISVHVQDWPADDKQQLIADLKWKTAQELAEAQARGMSRSPHPGSIVWQEHVHEHVMNTRVSHGASLGPSDELVIETSCRVEDGQPYSIPPSRMTKNDPFSIPYA